MQAGIPRAKMASNTVFFIFLNFGLYSGLIYNLQHLTPLFGLFHINKKSAGAVPKDGAGTLIVIPNVILIG